MNSNTLVFVGLAVVAVALGLFLLAPVAETTVDPSTDAVATEVGLETSAAQAVSAVHRRVPQRRTGLSGPSRSACVAGWGRRVHQLRGYPDTSRSRKC